MRRDIRFVGIQVLDEKPSRVGRLGYVLYAAPPAHRRPSGAADLAVTIAETTGHGPETVGHDAETAGHDDPKRRVGHDRRNHRSRCRNGRSRWSEIRRLGDAGRRVLVYADLRSLSAEGPADAPQREIELHITGNMERQIWGFDGKKYSEAKEPIPFSLGERLRVTFVNDTMMDHPMHLHGMWMVLENGMGSRRPLKHTINVKAGERLSFDVKPDEVGKWAFHCHLLFHMELGMFRVVSVVDANGKVTT